MVRLHIFPIFSFLAKMLSFHCRFEMTSVQDLIRAHRVIFLISAYFVYKEHQNIELHGCNKISKAILLFCSH